jgi:hypothetical protein
MHLLADLHRYQGQGGRGKVLMFVWQSCAVTRAAVTQGSRTQSMSRTFVWKHQLTV